MDFEFGLETIAEAKLAIEYLKENNRIEDIRLLNTLIGCQGNIEADEVKAICKEVYPDCDDDYRWQIWSLISEPYLFDGEYDKWGCLISRTYETYEDYEKALDAYIPDEYKARMKEYRNQRKAQEAQSKSSPKKKVSSTRTATKTKASSKEMKAREAKQNAPKEKGTALQTYRLDDVALPFEDIGLD